MRSDERWRDRGVCSPASIACASIACAQPPASQPHIPTSQPRTQLATSYAPRRRTLHLLEVYILGHAPPPSPPPPAPPPPSPPPRAPPSSPPQPPHAPPCPLAPPLPPLPRPPAPYTMRRARGDASCAHRFGELGGGDGGAAALGCDCEQLLSALEAQGVVCSPSSINTAGEALGSPCDSRESIPRDPHMTHTYLAPRASLASSKRRPSAW